MGKTVEGTTGFTVNLIQRLMVLSGGSCPRRTLHQRVVHQDGKAADETRPRDTLKLVYGFGASADSIGSYD
jgi:hypothetical protein